MSTGAALASAAKEAKSAVTSAVESKPASSPCPTCPDRAPLWADAVDPAARLFPKLLVSGPGDATEREADRVAEHVARSPKGDCGCGGGAGGDCSCPSEEMVQRAPSSADGGSPVSEAPPVVHQALAASGAPLDAGLRRDLEPRFGADLGHVRVHDDWLAASSAEAVAARAYTVGSHVVFGPGQFQPGTSEGRFLLAHELAHVVQQQGRRPRVQRAVKDRVVFEPLPQLDSPKACLVHLHGDERNALASAQNLASRCNVNLVHLNNTDRHLTVDVSGQQCKVDPNRLFTDPGLEANWDKVNGAGCKTPAVRDEGIRQVKEFRTNLLWPAIGICRGFSEDAAWLAEYLVKGDPAVVSFHNNSPGSEIEILSYCTDSSTPGCRAAGKFASETETDPVRRDNNPNPHIVAGQDKDDFFLVTQTAEFLNLRARGRNVVLQSMSVPDDGSLSVSQRFGRYANVEADTGTPLARNIQMGEEALAAVGAQCQAAAPARRPGGRAAASGELSSGDLPPAVGGVPAVFTRRVYDIAVDIVKGRGRPYVESVPAGDRVMVGGKSVHTDIAPDLTAMLAAARSALQEAIRDGVAEARGVSGLGLASGYRDAPNQFRIWQTEYPKYLRETEAARRAEIGGEWGERAARLLGAYVANRVYPAGYSPHQEGKTVDVKFDRNGSEVGASTAQVAVWRASWFFGWLTSNASRFNFSLNPSIDEPWHWEWKQPTP